MTAEAPAAKVRGSNPFGRASAEDVPGTIFWIRPERAILGCLVRGYEDGGPLGFIRASRQRNSVDAGPLGPHKGLLNEASRRLSSAKIEAIKKAVDAK